MQQDLFTPGAIAPFTGSRRNVGAIPFKSDWQMPDHLPDLRDAKVICLDLETCDPGLKERGPGCPRGEGFIAGLAIGTDDGYRSYFPMRHQIGPNMDPATVLRWAKDQLSHSQPKVGANLMYDLEWLAYEGVEVKGPLYDVQVAEPLLDENRFTYGLEDLAQDYLGEGKVESDLYKWCATAFGGQPKRSDQAKNIWRAPSRLAGPYGEGDVDLPLRIFEKQRVKLQDQELWDLFLMESGLLPVLLGMRRRGVRVNVAKAEQVRDALIEKNRVDLRRLEQMVGNAVNVNIPDTFIKYLDAESVPYPLTKTGKPSITKEWLRACQHPVAELIRGVRQWEKYRVTFVEGYILNGHVNGRIHGRFHLLKADEGGTISGRLSSSQPNLENIPAGEKDATMLQVDGEDRRLGKWVRSLFLPDEGETWNSSDYSQVEYRILTHFGRGESAERARHAYQTDPTTDFHNMVVEMTGLGRKRAKGINFGKAYGAGPATLAANMGVSVEEATAFLHTYDKEMPFVDELLNDVKDVAERRGYIKTILGRRARFEMYESKKWADKNEVLYTLEQATERFGPRNFRRAKCYKALNRLIQGSAADIFKKALLDIHQAGIMDVLGAPLNLVHDEICWSVPEGKEAAQAHEHALELMKGAVKLSVPLLVDSESGPNWGDVK